MRNLQSWYHAALGGVTFRLRDPVVEVLQSSYDSVWFQGDGEFASLFYRAADETWSLAGEGGYDDPLYRWVIYVDASPAAGQCGGCGTSGVAVLARGDLQGLAGEPRIEAEFTEYSSVCRYVGGLGHELGHAFGLPHPAVCDQGLPACYEGDVSPADSLLWTGYTIYPDSYFLPEQADALSASPFLASGLTVASMTDCKLITACGAGAATCNGVCSPLSDGLLPAAPLYNGSFEDCLYSPQGKPQAWDRQADDPRAAALTWDSTDVRDGAHSVRIQHATPNDSRWVQAIPIEPQRAYRFCGWIKTKNVVSTQGNAGANLSILGTSAYAGISGTDDWSEVCVPFHSGSNSTVTVAARLGMSFGLATGTAWFDSLRLEEVSPSVTPTHTFTPTSTAGATMTPTETRTATATMIFTDTPAPTPTREASDTPTSTRTPTLTPTVAPSPSRTPSRTPSGAPTLRCGGDCDRDGAVKVNELIIGVRIALLKETIGKCQAADSNGDGKVVVNELVRAVKIALRGC